MMIHFTENRMQTEPLLNGRMGCEHTTVTLLPPPLPTPEMKRVSYIRRYLKPAMGRVRALMHYDVTTAYDVITAGGQQ